jgi:hypothetical protein|tara:strand:+ start:841 stop:1125 length:285 start_codon:yes stop_codon:yes gene_type:complete
MTTSYKLEAIKALKARKKLEHEAEAQALSEKLAEQAKADAENAARIEKKLKLIASGESAPAEKQTKPVAKKKVTKKTASKKVAKKAGRPSKKKA